MLLNVFLAQGFMAARHTQELHEKWREKIRAANILDRLVKGYNGEVELTKQQVQIGLALMKKVLPDLSSVEQHNTGETTTKIIIESKKPDGNKDPAT